MKSSLFISFFLLSFTFTSKSQDTVYNKTIKTTGTPVVKLNKTPEALGISKSVQIRNSGIVNPPINIALFAVDKRDKNEEGNSDVIMIISINQLTKKIKMSSILRDTYVNIEGKGMDKLNAAFALGGPQLAIKTINQNFSMDIKDYINVDFFSAARIINALNGVNVNVKAEEIPYLNNYLQEISGIENIAAQFISNPGLQNLNGKQAVAYTRIRAVGRGDYERTERQRTVLIALFNKMKGAGTSILPVFTTQILPNLETSMSNITLFTVGSDILNSKTKIIEQGRFPLDSESKGERINNIWYLKTDLKSTSISLFNFIYKNIKPSTFR